MVSSPDWNCLKDFLHAGNAIAALNIAIIHASTRNIKNNPASEAIVALRKQYLDSLR